MWSEKQSKVTNRLLKSVEKYNTKKEYKDNIQEYKTMDCMNITLS